MKKMMTSLCLALCAFGTLVGFGQAGVTASRDYVNRKTELHEVMHPGGTNVVGYFLGTQTNKVLASKEYVDDSTPGDYAAVSNAAISAAAQTNDFLRKTGGTMTGTISISSGSRLHFAESSGGNGPLGAITSGSTNLTARAEMENYVTNITSKINDEIDYTTGNTQLVSTIESVAPVPGNYTVVSNAAMNARSMTDLCVRGVPQGEGSWFAVGNVIYSWTQSGNWQFIDNPDGNYIEPYEDGFRLHGSGLVTDKFVLNSQYEANPELFIGEYIHIVGYTNTLAQVSQIPSGFDNITDGTNTIDAAGNVYKNHEDWIYTIGSINYTASEVDEHFGGDGGYLSWLDNAYWDSNGVSIVSTGWFVANGSSTAPLYAWNGDLTATTNRNLTHTEYSLAGELIKATRGNILAGRLALTNDIPTVDYTTSNTQLVATIEATAPSPGDYANVSNAAMRARSMTDLSYNGIVTNDFWDVTGGVSVRLYRKQISGGADYWESQDGVWALAYAGSDWLFGQSQNPVYIYEPADAGSLSCTIGGTAYFLTRVSGKSGMIALTNDIPVVSAEDPTFSNAVVSVMINVETNTIAAINSLIDQGDELPVGGAATVGALLLAMAAAIAGLSKKKASKNVLTLVESGSAWDIGQNVSVLGRNFPASAWQGKAIAISGVSEVSITYGGYASDCSVKLDGTPIGTPDSVQITQDSILEVSFATCLDPDTPILMADKSEKKLSDVKVGDIVSTPFGPDKVVEVSSGRGDRMDLWEFEDGTTIRTIGRHRFWNVDLGEFMYLEAWNIGERALKADGTETRLAHHGSRFGDFGHATLFTEKGNVYYANGLVAGNRRSRTLRRSGT